jgi:DNA-binding CsgD family transcriptional regulator
VTEREREVLALVGREAPRKEIARRLGISDQTARTQAAVRAVNEGLVPPAGER